MTACTYSQPALSMSVDRTQKNSKTHTDMEDDDDHDDDHDHDDHDDEHR